MDVRKLDSVSREEQSAILSNVISRCMIENHMTLENLDEASEIVREIYRKNATMNKEKVDTKINLATRKIAKGCAECDVRLVAGQKGGEKAW